MRNKTILAGLAFVVGMLFSGCGSSMPKCDDKEVFDLLTQLVQKQWLETPFLCGNAEGNHDFDSEKLPSNKELHKLGYKNRRAYCEARKYDYSAFMINSADEKTKKISCKAEISQKQPHIQTLLPILQQEVLGTTAILAFMGAGEAVRGLGEAVVLFAAEEYFIKYTAQATQDGQVYVEVLGYE